jgi:hypothetical protein
MKTDRLPFFLDLLVGLAADEGARLLRRAALRLDGRDPELRAELWRELHGERTREALDARRELATVGAGVEELAERLFNLKVERDALREALDAERVAHLANFTAYQLDVERLGDHARAVAASAAYVDPGDEE